MTEVENWAYIDGQNLNLSTTMCDEPWKVGLKAFRQYLKKKYGITRAYYFLGCHDISNESLYINIQRAGFILIFRAHAADLHSSKKGNVDTDIVFTLMKNFHEHEEINKFYIVSGDGDYFKMVSYLLEEEKLGKILFPSHNKASSLYHQLPRDYYDYLDRPDIRKKIEYKKERFV